MRNIVSYIFASALVALLLEVIAPPAGFNFGAAARPSTERQGLAPQIVDRTRKSDRLLVPKASGRRLTPQPAAPVLVGCDAVFSPLSKDKQANYPGRCLA
jgi:hypothetical protein